MQIDLPSHHPYTLNHPMAQYLPLVLYHDHAIYNSPYSYQYGLLASAQKVFITLDEIESPIYMSLYVLYALDCLLPQNQKMNVAET
jgi:hypothetical protein